jgi:phage terminase large subunit-like protein
MAVSQAQWLEYKKDIIKFVNELVYVPSSSSQKVIKVRLKDKWAYQGRIIKEVTRKISGDKFKYSTAAICIPKQNGKTFMAALILLWRFMTHFNVQGVVASNSKDQASSVVFDTFKSMVKYSPEIAGAVEAENILDKEVRNPRTNSVVTVLSSSKAAAWGYGIDIAIVDEIHAAPDDEGIYNILASQTGPRDGQIILPSQVSSQLNILYHL